MHIKSNTSLSLSLEKHTVTSIEGTLVYDSIQYKKGKNILTIKSDSCTNIYSNSASARGLCTVIWDSSETLCAGCRISVSGSFSDSLFIADSLKVTDKKPVHFIRQRIILAVRQRLLSETNCSSDASLLSLQLILGTSEETSDGISSLAKNCGCLHVLALSGMHLNVVASFCNVFRKKKVFGKILKYLLCTLFVFIAGPRPSLIRALLMIYLSFLPFEERVFTSFILQSILFPSHMVNLGCIYAYTSIFALLVLSPYIKALLFYCFGRIPSLLIGSSVSVVLFNAPVQLLSDGLWYPACILAGPIAGFLASASMSLGFLKLLFPFLPFIDFLNNAVYSLMVSLFETFSTFPKPGFSGYILFASVILLMFLFTLLRKHFLKKN